MRLAFKFPVSANASPPILWEYFLMALEAWWAYLLLIPDAHLFATQPTFAGLSSRGPELNWGLVLAFLVALHGAGIVTRQAIVRALALCLSMFTWFYIAARIGVSAPLYNYLPFNTGWGAYGFVGVFSVIHLALLARNDLGQFYDAWDLHITQRLHKRQETP